MTHLCEPCQMKWDTVWAERCKEEIPTALTLEEYRALLCDQCNAKELPRLETITQETKQCQDRS